MKKSIKLAQLETFLATLPNPIATVAEVAIEHFLPHKLTYEMGDDPNIDSFLATITNADQRTKTLEIMLGSDKPPKAKIAYYENPKKMKLILLA